eukprot:CAMPEP_0174831498 /NCGR_PEP_ID=MMETSP1114-20130205/3127_1 /TAXON_ID=312471 /ORGANISM="Neobodo designis, Strain CCAP 1951/1" /LENGTH=570 /DNA_ID=CAMNT_0016065323 /DNA_START=26 /DNA_END=1735 /DNA_ORIENTATION=+
MCTGDAHLALAQQLLLRALAPHVGEAVAQQLVEVHGADHLLVELVDVVEQLHREADRPEVPERLPLEEPLRHVLVENVRLVGLPLPEALLRVVEVGDGELHLAVGERVEAGLNHLQLVRGDLGQLVPHERRARDVGVPRLEHLGEVRRVAQHRRRLIHRQRELLAADLVPRSVEQLERQGAVLLALEVLDADNLQVPGVHFVADPAQVPADAEDRLRGDVQLQEAVDVVLRHVGVPAGEDLVELHGAVAVLVQLAEHVLRAVAPDGRELVRAQGAAAVDVELLEAELDAQEVLQRELRDVVLDLPLGEVRRRQALHAVLDRRLGLPRPLGLLDDARARDEHVLVPLGLVLDLLAARPRRGDAAAVALSLVKVADEHVAVVVEDAALAVAAPVAELALVAVAGRRRVQEHTGALGDAGLVRGVVRAAVGEGLVPLALHDVLLPLPLKAVPLGRRHVALPGAAVHLPHAFVEFAAGVLEHAHALAVAVPRVARVVPGADDAHRPLVVVLGDAALERRAREEPLLGGGHELLVAIGELARAGVARVGELADPLQLAVDERDAALLRRGRVNAA